MQTSQRAIAHVRKADKQQQLLVEHLARVSELAGSFAANAGLEQSGKLVGILHDFGKYSQAFQNYLHSATGLLEQDHDDYVNAVALKGKVDHTTAGAQYAWRHFANNKNAWPYAQVLALSIASHHSSLIDCLAPNGTRVFSQRMDKKQEETHLAESLQRCDLEFTEAAKELLTVDCLKELHRNISEICKRVKALLPSKASREECEANENCRAVEQGLLVRFLLSCLLDADRIDSAEFEDPTYGALRSRLSKKPWEKLIQRLEKHLLTLGQDGAINELRSKISEACRQKALDEKGLFTLTVPTGGGKTLASLRFALHHAQRWNMERIIYVIPYTSIIDQNAGVARTILEKDEETGSIVLEHHSNLLPENESWQSKLLADNWEVPVVFTTMVQFLESLFGSGTGHARRMHNLADSVIIFDEIQTLPLRCMHMFCNAINFLLGTCGISAVLCTATQPCLGALPKPHFGSLSLAPEREIIPNVSSLFSDLKRVNFFDHCEKSITPEELAEFALQKLESSGSCLVVCNTIKWAEAVYTACRSRHDGFCYYLSTRLCPAHRMEKLEDLRNKLDAKKNVPVLCVSTQLIECGVDISFNSVIRCAAGLDSILQAAGRCNRHGGPVPGQVYIVRADGEQLNKLEDILNGRDIYLSARRYDWREWLDVSGFDLNQPEIIASYFNEYFRRRKDIMRYTTPKSFDLRTDTLLNMLGMNKYIETQMLHEGMCRQSFATAARLFQPVDSSATAVLVPYGQGEKIIAELASTSFFGRKRELLRAGQRYAVNLFPNTRKILDNALYSLQESDILALQPHYYDTELGVITRPGAALQPLVIG